MEIAREMIFMEILWFVNIRIQERKKVIIDWMNNNYAQGAAALPHFRIRKNATFFGLR